MNQRNSLALLCIFVHFQGCVFIKRTTSSQSKDLVTPVSVLNGKNIFEVFYGETSPSGSQMLVRSTCTWSNAKAQTNPVNRDNCSDKKISVNRQLFDEEFEKSFESFVLLNEPIDFLKKSSLFIEERDELEAHIAKNTNILQGQVSPLQIERIDKANKAYQSKIAELNKAIIFYSSQATDLPEYITSLRKTWEELQFWVQAPVPFIVAGGPWEKELDNELPKAIQALSKIISNAFENASLKSVETGQTSVSGQASMSDLAEIDKLSWQFFIKNARFKIKFKPVELKFMSDIGKWQSFVLFNSGDQIILHQPYQKGAPVSDTRHIFQDLKSKPVCEFKVDELNRVTLEEKKNEPSLSANKIFGGLLSRLNPKPKPESSLLPLQVDSHYSSNKLHLAFENEGDFVILERNTIAASENHAKNLYMSCGFVKSVEFKESEKPMVRGVLYSTLYQWDAIELTNTLDSDLSEQSQLLNSTEPKKFTMGEFKKVFYPGQLELDPK